MKKGYLLLIVFLFAGLLISACGGDGDKENQITFSIRGVESTFYGSSVGFAYMKDLGYYNLQFVGTSDGRSIQFHINLKSSGTGTYMSYDTSLLSYTENDEYFRPQDEGYVKITIDTWSNDRIEGSIDAKLSDGTFDYETYKYDYVNLTGSFVSFYWGEL